MSQPNDSNDQRVRILAESVPTDVINRINFISGSLDLSNARATVSVDGERFDLVFDQNGSLVEIEPIVSCKIRP